MFSSAERNEPFVGAEGASVHSYWKVTPSCPPELLPESVEGVETKTVALHTIPGEFSLEFVHRAAKAHDAMPRISSVVPCDASEATASDEDAGILDMNPSSDEDLHAGQMYVDQSNV